MEQTIPGVTPHPEIEHRNRAPVISPRQFYTAIGEVIGVNRIYELLRSDRIRHLKIGNRYLILRSEIDDFFLRESQARTG